ncbi:MAG: hypothetical protein ACAI35_00660 [Candidatus Methylacidiphilales bacterium]|nr:hypothetical protein [Candidatus Methylacidiphilales bacterium]
MADMMPGVDATPAYAGADIVAVLTDSPEIMNVHEDNGDMKDFPLHLIRVANKPSPFENTPLFRRFLAGREEIMKYRASESARLGADIGWEKALLEWITRYRSEWLKARHVPWYRKLF